MIWLIGSKGMLGSEIEFQLKEQNIPFIGTDKEVDITKKSALFDFTDTYSGIDWIINCAAYTDVDEQENNKEKAELINTTGAANIAETAKRINARLIHISTDYVFDGTNIIPYTEDMKISPSNVYGITKAQGEVCIENIIPENSYIIRTSWLYGFCGENFVYTITHLCSEKNQIKVVNDQTGSPTFAGDLAATILKLIDKINKNPKTVDPGIYHYSNNGEITYYEFACEIYEEGKKAGIITNKCQIFPCKSEDFPQKAKRPAYSVLCKSKIMQALETQIPDWKESLEYFMSSPRCLCK